MIKGSSRRRTNVDDKEGFIVGNDDGDHEKDYYGDDGYAIYAKDYHEGQHGTPEAEIQKDRQKAAKEEKAIVNNKLGPETKDTELPRNSSGSLAVDTLGSHKDSIDESKCDLLPTVVELLTSDEEVRDKGSSAVAIVPLELSCALEDKSERDIISHDRFKDQTASSTNEPNTNLLNGPSPTPRMDKTISINNGATEQQPGGIDGNAYYDYAGVYTTDSSSQGNLASDDIAWSHRSYYNANHEYPQNWSAQRDILN
eukprot:Gb_05975 [translate_table: standard]